MAFDLDHPFMLLYRTSCLFAIEFSSFLPTHLSLVGCVLPPVMLPQEHPRLFLYLRLHFFVHVSTSDFGLRTA
jgi:hypothetical protein